MDDPLVPVPAPAEISPVGCSSTDMFIILKLSEVPSVIVSLTVLNILLDLI